MSRRPLRSRGFAVGALVGALALALVAMTGAGTAARQVAPTNATPPAITGVAAVGSTLTVTQGAWAGSPTSFAFQWVRCATTGGAPDGSDCVVIAGATTQSYVVSSADTGFPLRVRVTATNADGSNVAASAPTSLIVSQSQPPVKVSDPVLSGVASVGSTLTVTQGQWQNNPTSFAFQWVRCPTSGGNATASDCAAIGGATTQSYLISTADVDRRLRVRVTASNASGSAVAASGASSVIAAQTRAPVSLGDPVVSGTPRVGSTLTATQGQWRNSPTGYAFQWVRCPTSGGNATGSDCAAIGGATTQAYQVSTADVGRRLRVRVTATNGDGSTTSASNATAIVRASAPPPPPPVATGCPAGSDAIRPDQITKPARLQIDRQAILPPVVTSGTTSITVRVRVSACGGRPVQGMLVFVTAVPYNQFAVPQEQQTGVDGFAQLTMPRLRGFPASDKQQLLVVFARARKPGEPLLGGISTRRLVSFRVDLRR